ncbi:hypothetical protein AALA00_11745 [Lachnospiraceae bacterium 46-15]
MKYIRKLFTALACTALLFCLSLTANASEESEAVGAAAWEMNGVSMDHQSVTFNIENVRRPQDAILVVSKENGDTIEIPFSITSAVERITVAYPDDGWFTYGLYYVWARDLDGNRCNSCFEHLRYHEMSLRYVKAYPCYLTGESRYLNADITATIGFEEYKAEVQKDGTFILRYPRLEPGISISVTSSDGYGCSNTSRYTVEDKYISWPSVTVFREGIALDGHHLSSDERVCAEVDGTLYYSDYGVSCSYLETKPIITYPLTTAETVTVWTESTCGSISKKITHTVTDCVLDTCSYSPDALYEKGVYPSKAFGTVKPNVCGQVPCKVSTTIGGTVYSANINPASGSYVLEYPRQNHGASVTLTFSDIHGCSSPHKYKVTNEFNEWRLYSSSILPSRITTTLPPGGRIAAEINGKVYKSNTATSANPSVTVKYPQQALGGKIKAWLESDNSSFTNPQQYAVQLQPYEINAFAKTTSIDGGIFLHRYYDKEPFSGSVYVEIAGKRYPCKVTKLNYESKERDKYEHEEDSYETLYPDYLVCYKFQASFPKAQPDTVLKVVLTDNYGYTFIKLVEIENTPPKLRVNKVTSDSTKITGSTNAKAGSLIEIWIGKKKYTTNVKKGGSFSKKIKPQKAGKSVDVWVTDQNNNYNCKYFRIKQATGKITLKGTTYQSSGSVSMSITNGKKGDRLKLSVGARKYSQKLKSNKKRQNIQISLNPKASAGTVIKAVLYDKFGKRKGSTQTKVYIGDTIYTGMSAHDAQLTTWGAPVRKNDWGGGYLQWVYRSGGSTLYVYIQNGRVVSMQRFN